VVRETPDGGIVRVRDGPLDRAWFADYILLAVYNGKAAPPYSTYHCPFRMLWIPLVAAQ